MQVISVRNVNTFTFCPRLLWIEHVGGEFEDNHHTIEGHFIHRRVDKPGGKIAAPIEGDEPWHSRSLWLSDDDLGLNGKLDLVDSDGDYVFPVDTKKGGPTREGGLWPADQVQLVLQALLLRSNGFMVEKIAAYYNKTRRRVSMDLSIEMITDALDALSSARAVFEMEHPPEPLIDSRKCSGCSLNAICLPDETNALNLKTQHEIRRVLVPTTDALPLYVSTPGAKIGTAKETAVITPPSHIDEPVQKVGLGRISEVNLMGGVQFSTQFLQKCMDRDIPVNFFTMGGWYYGGTFSTLSRLVHHRIAQFEAAKEARALKVARALIADKIHNSRVLIRRNGTPDDEFLSTMRRLRGDAGLALSAASLLGFEGDAARRYWAEFSKMISQERPEFVMLGRNRRPPKDPTNALLSLGYAMLTKDCTRALMNAGLDPFLGMFHTTHHGRPSLALDLMEPFRSLIVDSVVLQVVRRQEVSASDFIRAGQGVSLKTGARKTFISAYERRMNDEVQHPLFGYSISYRRILAVQARLLARFLAGEIEEFPEFRTR